MGTMQSLEGTKGESEGGEDVENPTALKSPDLLPGEEMG